MEEFFMDSRLSHIFKVLAPIIIKEGHNACQSRQGNRAKGQSILLP
jgi:hypothetical protein